ncbi:MAG: sugar transferase [Phascolarctobacterium sp.]|nr:sugar transferase [Candidatus Phascolarctobacterium equi]
MYRLFFKRLIDISCSGMALVVLSPVYLALFVLVRVKLGSPVFFTQPRPGLHGEVFNIYKFRTMTDARDEQGNLLPDEVRLTPFGKTLRSTSVDELPEIWNIFIGDMSIVGPRPLLVKYLDRYNDEQKHRHDVRPGLTGLAQVNGRNLCSWEEKFKYDVEYTRNVTFLGDIKILWKTVMIVLKREGISSLNNVTMDEFKGEEK